MSTRMTSMAGARWLLMMWLTVGIATSAHAQALDFNLSGDSAEGRFEGPLGIGSFGRGYYDLSFLYRDNDPRKNNYWWGLGAGVAGEAGTDAPGLEFGVAMKVHYGSVEDHDVGAVPLGGHIRYAPPPFSRFYAQYRLFFAPKIVTFGDGDSYISNEFRLGYEILPEADIYVGYRKVEVGIENGRDVDIDDTGYVGVQIMF